MLWIFRALEGLTYQLNSPIGLDLKLVKRALNDPLTIFQAHLTGFRSSPIGLLS